MSVESSLGIEVTYVKGVDHWARVHKVPKKFVAISVAL